MGLAEGQSLESFCEQVHLLSRAAFCSSFLCFLLLKQSLLFKFLVFYSNWTDSSSANT
jgi:hypothetical protein